jgi:hypothetical protein
MTFDDARKLLNGKNTAITDYFREKTSASLTTAFRPHVEKAMQTNGVTQQYDALAGQIPAMPFMKSSALDINSYVVGKALDGLFYMLGQQEKEIRTKSGGTVYSFVEGSIWEMRLGRARNLPLMSHSELNPTRIR